MGLFKKTHEVGSFAKHTLNSYIPCGERCTKCGQEPGCTKQLGHTTTFDGHSSNASTKVEGKNGCGHTWH